MEGYLFDRPEAQEAFRVAAGYAHDAGRIVSATLSDSFCVERHRGAFTDLVRNHLDLVFANEAEILALYGTEDFDVALGRVRDHVPYAALTRSEKGSVVVTPDEVIEVPAEPVEALVDTTGAGDLYASGFLYGFSRGAGPADCGHLGSLAAAEVISHLGARPEADLRDMAARRFCQAAELTQLAACGATAVDMRGHGGRSGGWARSWAAFVQRDPRPNPRPCTRVPTGRT